ncbi:MAG: hypothetical protein U0469_03080 [Candidatus Paceibacterota bacterium]
MFKKIFIVILFIVTAIFISQQSFAAFNLNNSCIATSTSQTLSVISQDDLSGTIPLCIIANANFPVNVTDNNRNTVYTTNTSGTSNFNYPTTGQITFATSSFGKDQRFDFYISDSASNSSNATIVLTPIPVPITLTATDTTSGLAIKNGDSIKLGDSVSMNCKNATELYYDTSSPNSPTVSDYTGASGYNLSHSVVTPPLGSHTIECDNIGYGATRQVLTFNVVQDNISGSISAPDCTIAIGASSCSTTVTWSTTNPGSNISGVRSNTNESGATSSNFVISTPDRNNGSESVQISFLVQGSHQGRNFYLYNNGTQLAQATSVANCVAGSTWDGSVCKSDSSCPPGQNNINGTCGVCPTGSTYDSSASKCVCDNNGNYVGVGGSCTGKPPAPICSFTDGTYNFVKCVNIPTCPDGNPAEVHVISSDGSDQIVPPPYTFDWSSTQYMYRFVCPASITTLQSVNRPYTHFINFNVSAGYIKKGTGINLSWIVQDPTSTCKIVATDIKTGDTLFDTSTDASYSKINKSVTTSSSTSQINRISSSNYKALINSLYTVNQSTRFTASCINPPNSKNYMVGLHKLVRDVYLTGESER